MCMLKLWQAGNTSGINFAAIVAAIKQDSRQLSIFLGVDISANSPHGQTVQCLEKLQTTQELGHTSDSTGLSFYGKLRCLRQYNKKKTRQESCHVLKGYHKEDSSLYKDIKLAAE